MTTLVSDIIAFAGGAVLLAIVLFRRTGDERMRQIFADRKKPGSEQQINELIAQEYHEQEARRAKQWQEAASSGRAARKLQREIHEELEAVEEIREYIAKERPDDKAGLEDLNQRRKEVEQDLARVAELIRHLRG